LARKEPIMSEEQEEPLYDENGIPWIHRDMTKEELLEMFPDMVIL
jgi:hypothetical protein